MSQYIEAVVELFVSFVLGALTVAWVEWYKSPKIGIYLGATAVSTSGGQTRRFLQVEIINRPVHRWLRSIFTRQEASNCFGTLEFQHLDGRPLFPKIDGRWSASLEIPDVVPHGAPFSPNLLEPLRFRDIYPNRQEPLTVALRWDHEVDCYGFNNLSYFKPNFKNPDWIMPEGQFRVLIQLSFSGQTYSQAFRIHNSRDPENFRLEAEGINRIELL